MHFQLDDTTATLSSFTGRVETHGKDKKPAVTLGFSIKASNHILDVLSPGLRDTLYTKPEGQVDIPGVDSITPLLRTQGIGQLSLERSFEGWTVTVRHGIADETDVVLGGCKVDAFRVQPHEGGAVDLAFRVGTSALSPVDAGLLWSKNGTVVSIVVQPPEPKQEAIDGSAAAFERDHPEAQGSLLDTGAPEMDATDHFIASAGA